LCITFVSINRQQNYVGKRFFVIRLPRRHHPGFASHDSPDLSLGRPAPLSAMFAIAEPLHSLRAGNAHLWMQMKNLKAFLLISGRILVIGAIEAIDRVINQAKLRRNHAALPDSKNTSPSRKEISA
jgi:hypothetical protein